MDLNAEQYVRYSRHLILPEVGLPGQRRLLASSVLLVGLGGLGSPAALYLAAAGVGRLGLLDFDRVDKSNLQRQIIHGEESIGETKVESAARRLRSMNPDTQVDRLELRLNADNAIETIRGYDVVIDGADNFPTRYLVNDACFFAGKPYVYGSIYRFEGQVTVFAPPQGPCYRCLYPEPPPPAEVPSCAEGGVFGVLPGVIGALQATECIKLLLGRGETLTGRLMLYDALAMRFRDLTFKRDPECPLCGDKRTILAPIDYEDFCGVASAEEGANAASADYPLIPQIPPALLDQRIASAKDLAILDIRGHGDPEFEPLPGSMPISLESLEEALGDPESQTLRALRGRPILAICPTGRRSHEACRRLLAAGFPDVANVEGGYLGLLRHRAANRPV